MKRMISLLLLCVMLFAMLPVFAVAEEDAQWIYNGSVVSGSYPDGNNIYKFEVTSHTNVHLFFRAGTNVQFYLYDESGRTVASKYALTYEHGAYILKYSGYLTPGEYKLLVSVYTYSAPFDYMFGMLLSPYSQAHSYHTYTFDSYVKNADCENAGYTVAYCMCGAYEIQDGPSALGHDWNYWVTEQDPTPDQPGKQTRKCNREGCKGSESEELQYGDHCHKFTMTDFVNPTCSTTGSYTYTCSCGETYVKIREIIPYEHTFTDWVTEKEPTVTEDGLQTCYCTLCGKENSAVLPKLDGSSRDAATPFQIGQVYTKEWNEANRNKSHYFSFSLPKDGYLSICGKSPVDQNGKVKFLNYTILDAQGNRIWSGKNYGGENNALEQVSVGLAAGTYYLVATFNPSVWGSAESYTAEYSLQFTPSEVYEKESNDTKENATEAKWNTDYFGFMRDGIDSFGRPTVDCWRIEADNAFEGRIYLSENLEQTGQFTVYFIDGQGNSERIYSYEEYLDAEGKRYFPVSFTKGTNYLKIEQKNGVGKIPVSYTIRFWRESAAPKNPFTDVPDGKYYTQPILWALGKGVTTGKTATTFEPNEPCTRSQIVTFLWRAMGSPEPEPMDNPFTDIREGKYYYKAVIWAVQQGITTGKTATTFEPDSPCTRSQVVTFLWRTMGKPSHSQSNPFSDIPGGKYYTNAVLWALENGITTGKTATTFLPNDTCTRAQIVTFLYRTLVED